MMSMDMLTSLNTLAGKISPLAGGDEPDPDTIKMFVGQVPRSMDESELIKMFQIYGPVHQLNILRDKVTGLSRGCCFVTFYQRQHALEAQNALHNVKTLAGMHHPIQMKPADTENRNERKVFIGMVCKRLTEDDIKKMFSIFGSIEECTVLRDDTGISRGCAFVTFTSRTCATAAIKGMHHSLTMEGCSSPLVVKFADTQKEKEQKKLQQLQSSLWSLTGGEAAASNLVGSPLTVGMIQLPQLTHQLSSQLSHQLTPQLSHQLTPQLSHQLTPQLSHQLSPQISQQLLSQSQLSQLILPYPDTLFGQSNSQYGGQLTNGQLQQQLTNGQLQQQLSNYHGQLAGQLDLTGQSISSYSLPFLQGLSSLGGGYPSSLLQNYALFQHLGGSNQLLGGSNQLLGGSNQLLNLGNPLPHHTTQLSSIPSIQDMMLSMSQPSDTKSKPGVSSFISLAGSGSVRKENLKELNCGPPDQMKPYSTTSTSDMRPHEANLFIYHLPPQFTDEDLLDAFQPFGTVVSARVFVDKHTNLSKCFGFVSYTSTDSATSAIQAMNGFQVGTKRLKVQLKKTRDGGKPY